MPPHRLRCRSSAPLSPTHLLPLLIRLIPPRARHPHPPRPPTPYEPRPPIPQIRPAHLGLLILQDAPQDLELLRRGRLGHGTADGADFDCEGRVHVEGVGELADGTETVHDGRRVEVGGEAERGGAWRVEGEREERVTSEMEVLLKRWTTGGEPVDERSSDDARGRDGRKQQAREKENRFRPPLESWPRAAGGVRMERSSM